MLHSCDINNITSPILIRRRRVDMIYSPSSILIMNQKKIDTAIALPKHEETN